MTDAGSAHVETVGKTTPPSPHGWRIAAEEWRTNWRIGVAAFLAIGLSFGAFQALSSLFVLPLQEEFGWSRSQIAFAYNASLVTALASPFVGRTVDRFGVRHIMLGGMIITGLAYIGMAAMTGSLVQYYALQVLASVIGLSASGLTCSRVVSEAFVHSRGLSLAIARSGLAMASALLPSVLFAIIATFSWRTGYLAQALLVFLVALPAVYLWIGRPRAGAGGKPEADRVKPRKDASLPGWTKLLSNQRVWILCLGAGLGYAPATAIMSQLQPLLVSKGLDPATAAGLVGAAGLASLFGALVTGSLVDRFWAPGIALLFACGSAAGAVLLAWNPLMEMPMATLAVMLVGVGLGAEIDVVAYMVARYFGLPSFSTIYGIAVFFIAFAGALGASLLGAAFDYHGNYDTALLGIAASFLAAGCLYLMLGSYPADAAAGSHEDQ